MDKSIENMGNKELIEYITEHIIELDEEMLKGFGLEDKSGYSFIHLEVKLEQIIALLNKLKKRCDD